MKNYGEEGEMDKKEKVSVIVTVKNDEAGIAGLMESLGEQTVKPDEVVVVRAGKGVYRSLKEFKGNVRVVSVGADCSRGRGRNVGIRMARNKVIAVTDAGCRPHRDWLENLIRCLEADKSYKTYKNYKNSDNNSIKDSPSHSRKRILSPRSHPFFAIAGGYRAAAKTELQRVMAAFLVPAIKKEEKDQKDRKEKGNTFLPASRSIMFTKKAWEAVGGYPEEAVSGAEDLEFARRLAAHPDVKMIYCPEAVVDWEPPATLGEFFRDIVKHTRGNVEVGYRPHLWRNLTVVLRWMAIGIWPWLGVVYLVWVIGKGIIVIKVINIINIAQIIIVQVAADAGVIWGLTLGILGRLGRFGKLGELGNIIHKMVRLPRPPEAASQ